MKLLRKVLIVIMMVLPSITNAQTMSEAEVKAALVLKFATLTDYVSKVKFESYVIVYVGSNQEMINQLRNLVKNSEIHGKPIVFNSQTTIEKLPRQINLLFLAREFNDELEAFWGHRNLQNTLLVTEDCENIYHTMINIAIEGKNTSFQINKMAMNSMNLNPSKDIVINGGSFIDLRKEYRATSDQLSQVVKEAENQRKILEKNKQELVQVENKMQEQNVKIKEQNVNILVQSDKIKQQESILNILSVRIEKQKDEIIEKHQRISFQGLQIDSQKSELELKKQQIELQNKTLEAVNTVVRQNEATVQAQEQKLQAQSNKIAEQRQIIFIVAIASFIVVLLLAIIFKAFLDKRKINKELDSKQKELIEKQQEVLQQSETLLEINTDLALQKQRVEEAFLQLKNTQAQLVQQEKMASLGVLTAGLAHEINNPINYISSGVSGLKNVMAQVEQLLNSVPSEHQFEINECREGFVILTNNIETGINRTSEIIRSLLTFSHSEGEKKKPANINANIDATLVILNNSYKNRISIVKNYGSYPEILCFPGRLNQVFMNILSNAIQSIEANGTIQIETRMRNSFVEIIISDTGKGINTENLNRIFEPFFTTKDVGQGTGLGLSISYNIIKQHNGQIFVESEVGRGSTFTISLPALIAH